MADSDDRLAALLARARNNLALEASPDAIKRLEARLHVIAAELLLEWIVGESRFENQSQQTEHWLARFYEEIYADEQPAATRIYSRFGLSLPRAQYFSRLLLARRTARWRDAARLEVRSALESVEKKSTEASDKKQALTQRFDLSLSRGGFEQLIVLYDALAGAVIGQNRPAPPKRTASSSALIWFSVTAQTVLALLTQFRGGEK